MELFAEYGYWGLFLTAFLAATILPISSEALLLLMVVSDDYGLNQLILVATAGNVLGAITNYWIGVKGSPVLMHKVLRLKPESIQKAQVRFQKYGSPTMLLAWMPFIGDPLTVAAGLFKMDFIRFLLLVFIGKLARYAIWVWTLNAL